MGRMSGAGNLKLGVGTYEQQRLRLRFQLELLQTERLSSSCLCVVAGTAPQQTTRARFVLLAELLVQFSQVLAHFTPLALRVLVHSMRSQRLASQSDKRIR